MPTAEYFDGWFEDIERSPARQELFTRHLGLPPEVGPSNMVPLEGLRAIGGALRLVRGGLLVDLACGRGGPGMFLAREAACQLIGVDFSPAAVRLATARRALFELDDVATFVVGDLGATGLADAIADAVVCVDAFGFASDAVAAATEMRRVLRPGGRVALTGWQPRDRGDERFPERMRHADPAGRLRDAGFDDVEVIEQPEWQVAEQSLWRAVEALDPGDDPALVSLHDEGARMAFLIPATRRLLVTASAP